MSDDELLELEHRGWEALSGRDGVAFYDKSLTDDALMVFPMGVFDRSDSLAAIRAAEPCRRFVSPMCGSRIRCLASES
jgi:hypothetical protein